VKAPAGIGAAPKERLLALLDELVPVVLENVLDERTSPKRPRAVVLTVEFSPFYETERIDGELIEHVDRENVGVEVKAATRLCAIQSSGPRGQVKRSGERLQIDLFA
jgi:hypothetical protein